MVSPFLNLSASINESLNRCGIDVGTNETGELTPDQREMESNLHRREVQNDGVKDGLLQVEGLVFGTRTPLSIVIPGTIAGFDIRHILATPVFGLNLIDKSRVGDRAVRIEVALFKAVDDDALCRGSDLDMRVGNTVLGEREVHISAFTLSVLSLVDGDLAKEAISGMGQADEEENQRSDDRSVDAVLDGREDGDKDCSGPDDEFERGNAPVGVDLLNRISR